MRFGVVTRARRAPYQKDRDAGQHDNQARTNTRQRSRQGLAAVGSAGAEGKKTVLFGAHLAGKIVDVAHGVAAGALAYDPGGVVHVLRLRERNGRAEFLDPLIAERNQLVEKVLLNGVVDDKLAQPLEGRRELRGRFLKVGLEGRQQS